MTTVFVTGTDIDSNKPLKSVQCDLGSILSRVTRHWVLSRDIGSQAKSATTDITVTHKQTHTIITSSSPWDVKLSWQHGYISIFYDDLYTQ